MNMIKVFIYLWLVYILYIYDIYIYIYCINIYFKCLYIYMGQHSKMVGFRLMNHRNLPRAGSAKIFLKRDIPQFRTKHSRDHSYSDLVTYGVNTLRESECRKK